MKTVTITIFIIAVMLMSCGKQKTAAPAEEIIPVRVTIPVTSKISIPVHSTGTLATAEELKLSFKTGGIIERINVSDGARVKKGTMLATLNLSEIQANADQAQRAREKALRDFQRADNLFRDSVATLEQKQNAATALEVAESTVAIAQFNLKHSSITAPADGIVLKQLARQNELVAAGYPVLYFGVSGKYWKVKTGLSDRDVVRISTGDSASVRFDAYPGETFSAVVSQVAEISNPYTGTYETELLLDGRGLRLATGFVANVTISPPAGKPFSLIPLESVVRADGMTGYVYSVDSSIARMIRVDINEITGNHAAVSGLPEGSPEIVTEGAAYLRDGVKVKVIQ